MSEFVCGYVCVSVMRVFMCECVCVSEFVCGYVCVYACVCD